MCLRSLMKGVWKINFEGKIGFVLCLFLGCLIMERTWIHHYWVPVCRFSFTTSSNSIKILLHITSRMNFPDCLGNNSFLFHGANMLMLSHDRWEIIFVKYPFFSRNSGRTRHNRHQCVAPYKNSSAQSLDTLHYSHSLSSHHYQYEILFYKWFDPLHVDVVALVVGLVVVACWMAAIIDLLYAFFSPLSLS